MARAATKPKATTLPVSERALLGRINCALAKGQDEALSAALLMVQRPGPLLRQRQRQRPRGAALRHAGPRGQSHPVKIDSAAWLVLIPMAIIALAVWRSRM